jgi:hypothetical protein
MTAPLNIAHVHEQGSFVQHCSIYVKSKTQAITPSPNLVTIQLLRLYWKRQIQLQIRQTNQANTKQGQYTKRVSIHQKQTTTTRSM